VKRQTKKSSRKGSSKKKDLGKYKSGLEKTCGNLLAELGLDFAYEEHEYEIMPKFWYPQTYWKMTPKSKGLIDKTNKVVLPIKYTPDFVAKDGSWIIETKGYIHSHHDFPMRWKLFMDYLIKKGEPLPMLFICRNKRQIEQAIYIIKQTKKDEEANPYRRARQAVRRRAREDAGDHHELL